MNLLRIYPSKTALTTLRVAHQRKMGIQYSYIPVFKAAPVVQWIELARPKRLMVVRFRPGAPKS